MPAESVKAGDVHELTRSTVRLSRIKDEFPMETENTGHSLG